jgi:hypothetical protein
MISRTAPSGLYHPAEAPYREKRHMREMQLIHLPGLNLGTGRQDAPPPRPGFVVIRIPEGRGGRANTPTLQPKPCKRPPGDDRADLPGDNRQLPRGASGRRVQVDGNPGARSQASRSVTVCQEEPLAPRASRWRVAQRHPRSAQPLRRRDLQKPGLAGEFCAPHSSRPKFDQRSRLRVWNRRAGRPPRRSPAGIPA